MAFGTVFDIDHYKFRDIFPSFLFAVLMINFSYVIAEYLIDLGNDLAGVFLQTIKTAFNGDASALWREGFAIPKLSSDASFLTRVVDCVKTGIFQCLLGTGLNLILQMIFVLLAVIAMLTVIFYLILRLPVLWILLIISPIAWFGLALPSIKKQTWDKWWEHFLGWTFSLPAYFFILMVFGILLKGKAEVGNVNPFEQVATSIGGGDSAAFAVSAFASRIFGINDIIFFFVTLLFMLWGIKLSFGVGKLFKGGAGKAFAFAQDRIQSIPIKGVSINDLAGGAKDSWERAKKEGIPGRFNWLFSGERGAKIGAGKAGDLIQRTLGFTNSRKGEKAIAHEVEEETKRFKDQNLDVRTFNDLLLKSPDGTIERQALRLLQAENGWFDSKEELELALRESGGGHSVAGHHLLQALEKSDYRDVFKNPQEKADYASKAVDHDLQKSLYHSIAKKLPNDAAIIEYLRLTDIDPYEKREKARAEAKESIGKLIKSVADRKAELESGTRFGTSKDAQKLLATVMLENEEITTSQEYYKAIEIFGAESGKAKELREKINKYSPLLATEIEIGEPYQRLRRTNPTLPPFSIKTIGARGTQRYDQVKAKFRTTLDIIDKKYDKVADASLSEWQTDAFYEALKDRIEDLENLYPTKPEHWEFQRDMPLIPPPPQPANSGAILKIQKDGAGRQYLRSIEKETADLEKRKIIKKIVDYYKGIDAGTTNLGTSWTGLPAWTD